ncbi:MAG: LysR family transcriptional regulator [Polyangiales bacterium]
MRWDDLRHFEAFVRTGSTGAAARELNVSTSTVYRRLEALEAALGAPLFVKGSDTELSDEGARIAALARHMRSGLGEVHQLAQSRMGEARGKVRLTTVEGLVPVLIEPIRELRLSYPELHVELHLADSGPSVRRREADIALGVMANPPESLVGRKLLHVTYGVFGTAKAVDARPRSWVVSGPPMENSPEARWEEQHAKHISLATGSRQAFLQFLRAGLGVGLFPRVLGEREGLKEAEELREAASTLTRTIWSLIHPDVRDDIRIRAVLDVLTKHLSALHPS